MTVANPLKKIRWTQSNWHQKQK